MQSVTKTRLLFYLFVSLIAVTLFVWGVRSQNFSAEAAYSAETSPETTEALTWVNCTPTRVASYTSRIHVRCASAVAGILYFAQSTANANDVARSLSLASTALVTGRDLNILYDPDDTSGTTLGCGATDCRLFTAIELK